MKNMGCDDNGIYVENGSRITGLKEYCSTDPCDNEAVTERNGEPYCYTCSLTYDRGFEDGCDDGYQDGQSGRRGKSSY